MKTSTSTFNPLYQIINLFPVETDVGIGYDDIERVKNLLDIGGVHCESDHEVIDCLEILAELGAINVDRVKSKNKIYFKVTKKTYGQ
jgi:hypothetical protein